VFVTHDQEEALELADRVVVMNRGRIEQVGTPEAVYHDPATPFVCEFVGKVNRIAARCEAGKLVAGGLVLGADPWDGRHDTATVYVRPEQFIVAAADDGEGWCVRVRHAFRAGGTVHLALDAAALGLVLEMDVFGGERPRDTWQQGACLRIRPRHVTVFPDGTEPAATLTREPRIVASATRPMAAGP